MADLSPRPIGAASSAPVTTLLALCASDYKAGAAQRISNHRDDAHLVPYAPAPVNGPIRHLTLTPTAVEIIEPTDLAVAVRVAQQLLDSNNPVALREALRLMLRALGAEAVAGR